jgi:tripartite-type tricarboxylate transporter receptor subunit TctC
LAAVLIACGTARAEDWPTRPITLVVPYAAGGPTDVVGRLFAQQMSETLGRQIVVENVPGAGGMTGANRVAHAAPDGYQVLFGGSGNLVYNQIIYKKPHFNSLTDFTPVSLLTDQSLVLIARKDLPANDLQGFTRFVQANKTASFGSAGAGSSTHLGCVMLNLAMGANVTHVPYRGLVSAHQDLIGGRIDYMRLHPDGASADPGRRRHGDCDPLAFALADAAQCSDGGRAGPCQSGHRQLVRTLPAERRSVIDRAEAPPDGGRGAGYTVVPRPAA